MEEVSYIGAAISGLLCFIVGARLFRLSVHTGEVPERLLGMTFLLWALYYFLDIIPYALVDESLVIPLFFAGRLVMLPATLIFASFTRSVFRNEEGWARWLIAGTVLCLSVGLAGSICVGDWGGVQPLLNPWYWLEALGTMAPFVWMAAESLGQYRKAKRRQRLNLCDPLVCNRYLLWGLASVIWVAAELLTNTQDIGYELTQTTPASIDFLLMTTELSGIAMVWLVFFPPTLYRHWINRLATVEDVAEEGSPHGG